MNKSMEKFTNIDEYHALQPAAFQDMLNELRLVIKEVAPEATETISYGMPAFKLKKDLVYYALNKKHIGFYPTPSPITYFKKDLEPYKTSKGAIQFPIDNPLPLALIKKIVQFRVDEVKKSLTINLLAGVVHEIPEDMAQVLTADLDLLERWNNLTPIQRNEWICWVTIVKTAETRAEHIQRMIEEINEGKKKPCCWPGCPHRNPNAQKWFK